MFESLVANLLNRFLGSYIENFDPKQLNIGIWNGDVKLHNLQLKKESLDKFKLPVDVKFGHLGELTLQIPWSNLKSKPVRIIIEDVYLLAEPILKDDYDPEDEKRREQELKKERLKDLEAIEEAAGHNQKLAADLNNNESFTESLVTKIVDNLQVTIRNIHVRYEDFSVLTDNPYSIGLTLKELSAVSTDQNWIPSFIEIRQMLTRKLLTLNSLSCYMNTDTKSIYEEDYDALLRKFKSTMDSEALSDDLQFILKPVTGSGRLTVNKAGATESHPHAKAELFFDEFGLELDAKQYRDILWTASKFRWYMKTQKFRNLRPTISVSENPKEWFRYAAKSILQEIHDRNYKWTWEYFAKRRDQRKEYTKVWKQRLLSKQLSAEESSSLKDLEEELSYEDIKFYRYLARNEFRHDSLTYSAGSANSLEPSNTQGTGASSNQNNGWFSWWSTPKQDDSKNSSLDLQLSDDQRKALYDAIDYDEGKELEDAVDIPKERVKFEVLTSLQKGGIAIKHNKNSDILTEVIFEGCTAQFYQRPDSFLTNFQLQEFRVEDGTGSTIYRHIVSVKQLHSHLHESSKDSIQNDDPFFQVSFEHKPLDGSADSILLARLKSMTIFYNSNFINEVIKFFTPPKIHLDTVGAIMNAAEAKMEGLTTQTRIGLQYALEEHKTINVKLDLQAPLIILPLDPTNPNSPVAILDAGHISVISNLVDKSKIEEVKSKENYTNEDWNKLNTLMYDQFNLHLQDAQFLVGSNFKSTMEELHNEHMDKSATILNKLNLRLLLGVSILPEAYNLAKFRISGEVPKISIAINDFQYKTIMQLIDVVLPTFDFLESDDSSIFDAFGNFDDAQVDDLTTTSLEAANSNTKRELSEAAKNQHVFEFDLDVNLVQVALSRCIDGVTLEAEKFVDLLGNDLHLNFYKTANDMHLHLSLADINLIDHIEKSGIPEFERLISSNNFDREDSVQNDKKLFQLEYQRIQRIVDFNGKGIEVFDQDINMDIATVKFVVSRKSILSMLNFALNTFTDPNAEPTPADELKHNDSQDDELSPQKINVNINLDSIIMVLNDDGVKLATLKLSTANIKVFLVPEEMEVLGKLGALTLRDEISEESSNDKTIKNLITMEGDSLAEFNYKTFDNETNSNYFNSIFTLKTGAHTINVVEDSFRRIYGFLSKFQRMKAIYDRAREAAINQASQIEYSNKLKFELKIQTPTIVFPRASKYSIENDKIIANLGELYASNEFVKDRDSMCNKIAFGIQNTNLTSIFNYENDIRQVSEVVKDMDISFSVKYFEDFMKDRPTINIKSEMPPIEINLTENQLNHLLSVSESVSNVFSLVDSGETLDDVEMDARNANAVVKHNSKSSSGSHGGEKHDMIKNDRISTSIPSDHSKIILSFDLSKLALTIYNKTDNVADFGSRIISSFSLNNMKVQFKMKQDDHFVADVTVKSFIVSDERTETTNKFREIIPEITHDENQFVLSASSDGPSKDKNITVILSVDNPRTLIALDYLFELQLFLNNGLGASSNSEVTNDSDKMTNLKSEDIKAQSETMTQPSRKLGFSINIKEPTLMLLADSSKEDTEAIVFRVEQVLITSQNIISLAANNIGMFLCTMNDFNTNYRIIDDFSISFAFDSRDSTVNNYLTNVQLTIDPILVRVSLRDIRLAVSIFNRANELYNAYQVTSELSEDSTDNGSDVVSEAGSDGYKKLTDFVPNVNVAVSATSKGNEEANEVIIKGEEFNASLGGIRFVLIGDVHELPVLDMNLKPFEGRAINWSTDLSAETHVEFFVNIYNYSRSTWEPLVEAWPVAVYASRASGSNFNIMVDIVSRKLAEITVSSRSIALLSQMFSSILTEDHLTSRGGDSPYEIHNDTGFDLEIWIDKNDIHEDSKTILRNKEKTPWAFESWKEVRQNLASETKEGVLAVSFVGDKYKEVHGISVTGEGEELYMLTPTVNNVHTRLSCEVTLREDNIKTVRFKSTISIQNDADVAIALKLSGETNASKSEDIIVPSKGTKSLPLDYVYSGRIKIKPHIETSYEWSNEELYWKDLMQGVISLRCHANSNEDKSSFYFQAEASYDKDEPLAKIYPHMSLIISAPLEIENLLPFDLSYRLYDKGARKDWSGKISKGVKSYVHVISLKHLLLLSIEPLECGYGKSEFAIINTSAKSEFKREENITLRNNDGQLLNLRIYYPRKSNKSTSLKVVIYSPYVILNRTQQDITLNEKGNLTHIKGKSDFKSLPSMFSFDKFGDRKNRALLKINGSTWTSPLSFDAIGQSITTKAQIAGKQKEMNVGLTVSEGEGKYNLTKVVSIAPRYVLKNTLSETIQIVEHGSSTHHDVESSQLLPLYGMRRSDKKSLLIKFAQSSKTWSSPFSIDDIGQLFIKVHKENIGQSLVKVNILLENATVFIQLEDSNNHWPFSIRNFSEAEFYIYQTNPNVNENGDVVKHETNYKPIYYKVPPKSVMPYAYDYPNAIVKELVIRSHGRERSVNLSEIGNLKPFRLPPTQDSEQAIVDLNVVADGPVQSLVITNYDPSVSLYKLQGKSSSSTTTNLTQTFEATENDENYFTKIITKFEGLGISLINTRGQELCYITLRGLEIRYNESDLYQNLSVKLKWIQIDNQLYGGIFPIILYPTLVPKSGKEMNSHPSFSCALCKVKDNNHGVLFIKYATLLLQEMTCEIDEDFLFALLDFAKVPGAVWNKGHVDKLCDDRLELTAPVSLNDSSDVYFEALHLQPTLLNLSFVRTERVNVEDKASSQNALMFFFNVLTMAIGNINDAPIKLNALFIENIRVPIPILVESIQTHYGQAFFYQVHKILGSADFLGNPVGLFNHLSSGVLDIFYEPYQGFVINDRPQELGIGIAKGGLSFLKKSIYGFSDSFAKVTGSLAKGLSVVTLDRKFQERRRLNQRRNRPKHAMYGFATGANSFFESVSSGVTGFATAPLEGANRDGASGFFKGLGKGVVGLPTKTAIGFFDLASNVSEGIRNTTTVFDAEGLDKVRLPRYISHDNVVRPYSQREAQGQFWLKSIDGGVYFEETYLAHLVLSGEEKAILVTYRKIVLVQLSSLKTLWVISFDQIKSISIETTGINIGLKRKEGSFIPIPERSSRNFLYSKIGIAVQEFNKHCQVVL